jgi:hypothetical protein
MWIFRYFGGCPRFLDRPLPFWISGSATVAGPQSVASYIVRQASLSWGPTLTWNLTKTLINMEGNYRQNSVSVFTFLFYIFSFKFLLLNYYFNILISKSHFYVISYFCQSIWNFKFSFLVYFILISVFLFLIAYF